MLNLAYRPVSRPAISLIVQAQYCKRWHMGGWVGLPIPLSYEEERKALRSMNGGNLGARNLLILHGIRLVIYVARKFENAGVGLDDLISVGIIGLIKAINSFDTEKKVKLATYASRCIKNEILMVLRKTKCLRAEVSLDVPLNTDRDGNELLLSDLIGTDGDVVTRDLDADADRRMLYDAICRLEHRERKIVNLRFGLRDGFERTQKEVAEIMGMSQSYISRLEQQILKRLRADLMESEMM